MNDDYLSFHVSVGRRIRRVRKQRGLTQADLAEMTGLALPSLSSIENGHSKLLLISFVKIAEALQVSADDLLRLNTPAATTDYPSEFAELFEGCNHAEAEAILKVAEQVHEALEKQKKKLTD